MSKKFSKPSSKLKLVGAINMTALIIALIVFTTSFSGMAVAQTDEDSAAVRRQFEAYERTFNTHDPVALSKFFTEDADFVMGNLPEINGRQAIENWWRDYWRSKFNKQEPARRGTFNLHSLRFLSADVALANIESTTGGRDSLGAELQTRKARGTWLLHRQNGNWLISAIRGMPTEKDSIILGASIETAESLRPQIRAFVDAYQDAWNSHDPTVVTAFYRNDADIIVRNSPLIQGKQAIEDWWRAYFSKPRPYKALLIIDEIRTISNNVVQINVIGTGAVRETGDDLQPLRQARAMWVLVRESGDWLIAALRILPSEDDRLIRRGGH